MLWVLLRHYRKNNLRCERSSGFKELKPVKSCQMLPISVLRDYNKSYCYSVSVSVLFQNILK